MLQWSSVSGELSGYQVWMDCPNSISLTEPWSGESIACESASYYGVEVLILWMMKDVLKIQTSDMP